MSTSFHIRSATRSDATAIAALLQALYHAEGNPVAVDTADLQRRLFDAPRGLDVRALVACDGDTVVGTLVYYAGYDVLSASDGYHLADMIVAEGHRRRGVAKALFKALAKQALAEAKEWVSLTALRSNGVAKQFYASLGMTQVDVDFFAIGKTALGRL